MNDKRCFIVGLPNAGKTTFLAALWYSLVNSKNNILQLYKLTGNKKYLQSISEAWANVQKLSRTMPVAEKLNLEIALRCNDSLFTLNLPDLSGETFQNHYTERKMSKDIAEYIIEADAILLFINTTEVKDIIFHSDLDSDIIGESDEIPKVSTIIRDVKNDPMAVQLVDILQFIEELREKKCVKLGIMLSAWDEWTETEFERVPELFVQKKMSLLWQYLHSNSQIFQCQYWGISAQGGTMENGNDEILQNYFDQTERIFLIANDGSESKDITVPIFNLLGE